MNIREPKMKRIAIVLPLAVMLCSCASPEKKHIGTWQATGIAESGYAVKLARKGRAECHVGRQDRQVHPGVSR
jgi:ABC-type uncharacterized transport system auxiliary subunit